MQLVLPKGTFGFQLTVSNRGCIVSDIVKLSFYELVISI